MSRITIRLALLCALTIGANASPAHAQSSDPCPRCGRFHTVPYGPRPQGAHMVNRIGPGYSRDYGNGPVGLPGLPRGRRYYNGRFFGSFNNRFYGPQYGNF